MKTNGKKKKKENEGVRKGQEEKRTSPLKRGGGKRMARQREEARCRRNLRGRKRKCPIPGTEVEERKTPKNLLGRREGKRKQWKREKKRGEKNNT